MEKGFLAQQSKAAANRNKKIFIPVLIIWLVIVAAAGFFLKDSIDLSDRRTVALVGAVIVLTVIMVVSVAAILILAGRWTADAGKILLLPFNEGENEAVAEVIDREIAEGKVQVDEYIENFEEGRKPYGDRIILLPSYLLYCNGMGRITVIPRDKIYWICAQAGRKGQSSFIVRLLIFTEKKIFAPEGADVAHIEKIADKIYQYIPNIFSGYDPFALSYELENMFNKNREEFLRLYNEAKSKVN